ELPLMILSFLPTWQVYRTKGLKSSFSFPVVRVHSCHWWPIMPRMTRIIKNDFVLSSADFMENKAKQKTSFVSSCLRGKYSLKRYIAGAHQSSGRYSDQTSFTKGGTIPPATQILS